LEEAKKRYAEEVHSLVNLVKAECTDIFSEVERNAYQHQRAEEESRRSHHYESSQEGFMENPPPSPPPSNREGSMGFEEGLLKSHQSSVAGWGGARLSESITSRRTGISGLVVAPEMLSPEETQELVRSILSRSSVASISVRPSDKAMMDSTASTTWSEHRQQKQQQQQRSYQQSSGAEGGDLDTTGRRERDDHSEFMRGSGSSRLVKSPPRSFPSHGQSVLENSSGSSAERGARSLPPPSATFSPSFHNSGSSGGGRRASSRNPPAADVDRNQQHLLYQEEERYQHHVANRMERMIAKLDSVNR
jgi:hypothetical protein